MTDKEVTPEEILRGCKIFQKIFPTDEDREFLDRLADKIKRQAK